MLFPFSFSFICNFLKVFTVFVNTEHSRFRETWFKLFGHNNWTTSKTILHKCACKYRSQGLPGEGDCRNELFLNQSEPHIFGEAIVRIAKQETQGLDSSYAQTQERIQMVRRAFKDGLDWRKKECITPPGPHLMLCSTCFSKHRMCLCSSCENKDAFKATVHGAIRDTCLNESNVWLMAFSSLTFNLQDERYQRKEKRLKGKESIRICSIP